MEVMAMQMENEDQRGFKLLLGISSSVKYNFKW